MTNNLQKSEKKNKSLSIDERLTEIERAIVNFDKDYLKELDDIVKWAENIQKNSLKNNLEVVHTYSKYNAKLRRLDQKECNFYRWWSNILFAVWLLFLILSWYIN